ncbi:RNA polymerase sigma factor [Actinacidiphila sp. ITFR-21]|uniref:RNA polymerase sigma factor n=1 Tax=Actinacidiphila sp. ITFR-21 TaxID=3075199 RepID=UPI002889D4FB|nr:sigma-70 family RNA polymerase sigma factor [Streptomyces sp. ITFR-21]WNI17986.1 sigma-70 family RNA polymerase sigma factor [Streptomyces sp. ITFR-21]
MIAMKHERQDARWGEHRWALVLAERERLLRLVAGRLGRTADVEDCVQEALIRAATYDRLDEARVGALLTTITLRLCVDQQRRTSRDQRLAVRVRYVHGSDRGPDVENQTCERAAGRWLLEQLSKLGVRERQVMLARADGMSTAEAAQALNITHKSAESAFTRARSRLRSLYQEEMAR